MQLSEKYRPRRLAQIVGQEAAVKRVRGIMSGRHWDRDAFWIEGATGVGKTTLARAIARELGCDQWAVEEIDGDQCSIERVRGIGERIDLGAWSGPWRVYIVNEAHAMTPRAVQAWLTLLERLPRNRLVIFTSTSKQGDLFGDFAQPFGDRCKMIRLTNQHLSKPFARLAARVANREGLNGKPVSAYAGLVARCHNSMRAVYQAIEAGDMLAPG